MNTVQKVAGALLRTRLYYKILIANAALIVVATAAVAGAAYAGEVTGSDLRWLAASLAVAGIVVSVGLNALILRIALRPLDRLERAAAAVRAGEIETRVVPSSVADRNLARLTNTFNQMLDQLLLYRRRLRTMAARALDIAEEERSRLARDLHDDTAQSLANLMLRLRAARATRDEGARDRLLDEVRAELATTVESMRRLAHGLHPPALDVLGLAAAVEREARKVEESSGLDITVYADDLAGALPPAAELALYRIVQEALDNVARHARASSARVTLRRMPGLVRAVVEDSGRGFSIEDVAVDLERGFGLFGMEERATYIGGHLRVQSRIGRGTRVEVDVSIGDREAVAHVG